MIGVTTGASRKSNNFFLSQFLIRHPFLTIGLFIFAAVVVFIYFVVLVPLCGNDLQVPPKLPFLCVCRVCRVCRVCVCVCGVVEAHPRQRACVVCPF